MTEMLLDSMGLLLQVPALAGCLAVLPVFIVVALEKIRAEVTRGAFLKKRTRKVKKFRGITILSNF